MRLSFKNFQLATKLTFAYLLFIIIPFCVFSIYNYTKSLSDISANLNQSRKYITNQLETNIYEKQSLIENIVNNISSNDTMTMFLSAPYMPLSSTEIYRNDVLPIIENQMSLSSNHINRIFIITKDNSIPDGFDIFYNDSHLKYNAVYQEFIKSGSPDYWYYHGLNDPSFVDKKSQYDTVTYIAQINSPYHKVLGSVLVEVDKSYLFSAVADLQIPDAAVQVVDSDGKELFSSNMNLIDFPTKTTSIQANITPITIELNGMNASINFYFQNSSKEYLLNNSLLYSIIFIALLLVGSLMFYLFLKSTFRKINENVYTIDHVVSQNLDIRLPINSNDELGQIAKNFNVLLDKIQALIKDGIKKETMQKDAQLKALLMQIKPHFIYNTIDMFSAKMELCGQYEVADYMADFAKMIRYNTRSTSILTTLTAEIDYTCHYINLQRCKYNNQISMKMIAHGDLTPYKTIRFILQPVVENAIIHGFKNNALNRPFQITIKIKVIRKIIYIIIEDNGCGMTQNTVESLNQNFVSELLSIDNEASFGKRGIGIHNINNRMKLFYGEPYHLIVRSKQGEFTKVYIRIPVEKEEFNNV